MTTVIGWLATIAFLIAATLFGCYYHRVWHDLLMMPEPFTAWFSRIALAHPLFWWGGVATFALIAVLTAYFGLAWERLLGIISTGFFAWFIPHIIENVQKISSEYLHAEAGRMGYNLRWFGK